MASHSSGTGTPSTDPSQQQQQPPSSYLSYPVSHVVSGLYRRLTDNAPTRLPKVLGRSASHQPEKAGSATLEAPTNSHAGLYTPPNRNASPFQPPPLTPLTLSGADDDDDDPILTNAIAEEIRLLVPPRLQLAEHWRMIYSLERDGVSLHTLYNKCASSSTPQGTSFVLVVQDGVGGIFGAYLTDPPKPRSGYYGTGECFLWRASLLPVSSSTNLLANLPPPPSAPEAETRDMGRSTTIASPTSPKSNLRMSFSSSAERRRRRSSAAAAASKSPPKSPTTKPPLPSLPSSSSPTLTQLQPTPISPPPPQSPSFQTSSQKQPPALHPDHQTPRQPSPQPTQTLLRFKAFPYSGINDYLILCETTFLSVGGGDGKYGLWLDEFLERGQSGPSLTFGNEGLSDEGDGIQNGGAAKMGGGGMGRFEIVGVEVWGVGA